MREALDATLFLKCPLLFRLRHENCLIYGIECESGWYEILYDLCQNIEAIALKQKNDGVELADLPYAMQIKEKFAGLRFYLDNSNDEIDSLINKAVEQAATTCAQCGKLGSHRTDLIWRCILCDECYSKVPAGHFDDYE